MTRTDASLSRWRCTSNRVVAVWEDGSPVDIAGSVSANRALSFAYFPRFVTHVFQMECRFQPKLGLLLAAIAPVHPHQ